VDRDELTDVFDDAPVAVRLPAEAA